MLAFVFHLESGLGAFRINAGDGIFAPIDNVHRRLLIFRRAAGVNGLEAIGSFIAREGVEANTQAIEFIGVLFCVAVEHIFRQVLGEAFDEGAVFRTAGCFFVRCQVDDTDVYLAHAFHEAAGIDNLTGRRFPPA